MSITTKNSVAGVDFRFSWKSDMGSHTDCYHGQCVNFWRDIFPKELYEKLLNKFPGEEIKHDFKGGDIVSPYGESNIHSIKRERIERERSGKTRYGRYYPKGILKGIAGVFKANREPFRCVRADESGILADMNHPLSGKDLSLTAVIDSIQGKTSERGGSCMALEDMLFNGPGMQARGNGLPTDFFTDNPFEREDETDDARFYHKPRLVNHLDEMAIGVITERYGKLIKPGSKVLDLMSSWKSHLPGELELDSVVGLGMNAGELDANPRLSRSVLQDLNLNPVLPFEDGEFDVALCAVSVEYLVRPLEVFSQVARVLKPGGLFIVSFSNRWFPPKAIRIWKELHEFERMGLVSEYFMQSKKFNDIHTWSMRGKPRPYDDKYFGLNMMLSDPVFMVWGSKAG